MHFTSSDRHVQVRYRWIAWRLIRKNLSNNRNSNAGRFVVGIWDVRLCVVFCIWDELSGRIERY
jgi:hypothetical protein